jgi:TetR/AcrR family transcriptional regulator, tetracycline repressor protein
VIAVEVEKSEVSRQPLSRDRILDAALRLGDQHGIDGLSMRRVARELGVEAMSLYKHVPNKAAIITGILERVFSDIHIPDRAQPWPQRIRAIGRQIHRAFSTHPIAVVLITTGTTSPRTNEALRPVDEILAALHEAGFDDRDALRAANALTALVFGTIQLRPAREDASEDNQQDQQWFRQSVSADVLPHLHRAIHTPHPPSPDEDFHYQLELLITGLQQTAEH